MAVEALVIGIVYCLSAHAGNERWRAILGVGLAWVVGLVVGLGTVAYFYFTGRWEIFWDTLFTYDRFYSGDLLNNLLQALEPQNLIPGWFWFAIPLGFLTVIAVILGFRNQRKLAWIFTAFLFMKFIEKALPGKLFRHHYYQILIPALCLGAGWALSLISEKYSKKGALLAGGMLVLTLGVYEGRMFLLDPDDWSRQNYGFDYVGVNQVVQEVNLVLKPEEEFYEWAEYPRFYYACNREPPVSILSGMHLFNGDSFSGGPLAGEFVDRNLKDLEKNQPELVIWDNEWKPEGWQRNPVVLYLMAHYRPFAVCGLKGRFEFQCRVGGNLDQRLRAAAAPLLTNRL